MKSSISLVFIILLSLCSMNVFSSDEVSLVSAFSRTYSFRGAQGQDASFLIEVKNLSATKSVNVHYRALDGVWVDLPATYVGLLSNQNELWEADLSLCTVYTSYGCPEVTATDLTFALKMHANGVDYWDNNVGGNYYLGKNDGYMLTTGQNVRVLGQGDMHCNTNEPVCSFYGGGILLQNLAPDKTVVVGYTVDDWASSNVVEASFVNTSYSHPLGRFTNPGVQGTELWSFSIPDLPLGGGELKYFVKYSVNGNDYYDNNYAYDYRVAIPNYPSMYLVGTNNNWLAEYPYPNMVKRTSFNGESYWEGRFDFTGHNAVERFKFDVYAQTDPWAVSFGEADSDGYLRQGVAEQYGGDIKIMDGPGQYEITIYDGSLDYKVEKLQYPTSRTLILIEAPLDEGEAIYLRGGIDWDAALTYLDRDCSETEAAKWNCAVSLSHRILREDADRMYDRRLDWYGAEPDQATAEGTPLIWTTNDSNHEKTVAADNEGYTPLNTYGANYWMLDADMYCSNAVEDETGNRWVEFKTYVVDSEGNGEWEQSVDQANTPYDTTNHFAVCGKVNVFKQNQSDALILNWGDQCVRRRLKQALIKSPAESSGGAFLF